MKGTERKISVSGRITIPSDYRKILKIKPGQGMIYSTEGNVIRLKKRENGREIDTEGRYIIPKEVRVHLDIIEGDRLDIWLEEDIICMKKTQPRCELCKTHHNLMNVNKVWICRKCGNKIVKAMRKRT